MAFMSMIGFGHNGSDNDFALNRSNHYVKQWWLIINLRHNFRIHVEILLFSFKEICVKIDS